VQGRNRYYLPASNDGEIHRRLDVVVPCNLEGFPLVSHHRTELFHIARIDSSIRTHKVLVNVNVGKNLIVAMPQLPVKLFNALVMASGNFVNGCEAL
jgi:hypothetical protein